MVEWGFTTDQEGLGFQLRSQIGLIGTTDIKAIARFDHCTYYTGANDERVIVTQPYGDFFAHFQANLTLDDGVAPEIIVATEWAFYYPGRADLIILKFPDKYAEALKDFIQRQRQRSHQTVSTLDEDEAKFGWIGDSCAWESPESEP